jgi:hypothetical protein
MALTGLGTDACIPPQHISQNSTLSLSEFAVLSCNRSGVCIQKKEWRIFVKARADFSAFCAKGFA